MYLDILRIQKSRETAKKMAARNTAFNQISQMRNSKLATEDPHNSIATKLRSK